MGRVGLFSITGRDNYNYNTFDISIGKRFFSEWFYTSIFIGPTFISGKYKLQDRSIKHFNTMDLQSEIQFLFRPANEIGFGFGAYGNLNFKNSYYGLTVIFTLGNGK